MLVMLLCIVNDQSTFVFFWIISVEGGITCQQLVFFVMLNVAHERSWQLKLGKVEPTVQFMTQLLLLEAQGLTSFPDNSSLLE